MGHQPHYRAGLNFKFLTQNGLPPIKNKKRKPRKKTGDNTLVDIKSQGTINPV